MKTISLTSPRGKSFTFECEDVVNGVAVNPLLSVAFDDTPNELRGDREMSWWEVPFIRTESDDDPKFLERWPIGIRYDVRCLDGGAWDRSTNLGAFSSLGDALEAIKISARRIAARVLVV